MEWGGEKEEKHAIIQGKEMNNETCLNRKARDNLRAEAGHILHVRRHIKSTALPQEA